MKTIVFLLIFVAFSWVRGCPEGPGCSLWVVLAPKLLLGRQLEASGRHRGNIWRRLEARAAARALHKLRQAGQVVVKRLIPGGSRKPGRKVTTLLAAGYKAAKL